MDVNEHIQTSEITSSSFQRYLSSFVFPLLSSLSLAWIQEDDWFTLSDQCILLIKRIEYLRMHMSIPPCFEFLECLLCKRIMSSHPSLTFECVLDSIQNGLNATEPSPLNLPDQAILTELMEGKTPRMKSFFSLLEGSTHIPSIIFRKYYSDYLRFCRYSVAFHIHNLSLSAL